MARLSMSVVLALLPSLANAADDPIKVDLDKARSAHAEKVGAAKSAILTAFDAKLKEVAGKDDLDGAKAIKAQKEEFEKSGKLPTAAAMTRPKADYEAAVRAAEDGLRKSLAKAKTDYTKALQLDEAEAVAAELAPPAKKANVAANDPLVANSGWKGLRQVPATGWKDEWELAVEERDGEKFKGEITLGDGRTYSVEGSVKKDKVRFKSEKKGFFDMSFTGELKGGELKLSFTGTNIQGKQVSGIAYLKPR